MKFTLSTLAAIVVLAFPAVVDAQPGENGNPNFQNENAGQPCDFTLQDAPGNSGGKRKATFNVPPGQVNRASRMKLCDSGFSASSDARDKTFKVVRSTDFGPQGGQRSESWVGEADDGSSLSFVVDERGHSTASYVNMPENTITDIYTDANGNLQSVTKSGNDYPEEADPEDLGIDLAVDEDGLGRRLGLRGISSDQHQSHRHLSDDGSQLDVLVLWTPYAECRNSGLPRDCTRTAETKLSIEGRINLAITETNTAYDLSGVNTQLNLVHSALTLYTEASSNAFGTALSAIQSKTDGVMDEAHTLRTQYGADIVALLIDDPQYCGIGYLGPSTNLMFSVTAWNCATGYYSFGHEIGHNMGLNHDKGTANTCSSSSYNYGYRDPAGGFRSVLAYNCRTGQCDNNARNSCPRVNRYSNPNYDYNGKPIGNAQTDNARQINDVRATVAAYYTHVPKSTTSPTTSPTGNPTVSPTKGPTASPADSPTEVPTLAPNAEPVWELIGSNGFEDGSGGCSFNGWVDGGDDARLIGPNNKWNNVHWGNCALRLQDDSDTSTATSETLPVANYDTLKVTLWYKPKRMTESTEEFHLYVSRDGGSSYALEHTWTDSQTGATSNTSEFTNNIYQEGIVDDIDVTDEVSEVRIRFVCNGKDNSDVVFIDDVKIEATSSPTKGPTASPTKSPSTSPSGPPSCPAPGPFYEDFSNGFDSNKWLKAHKSWGSSGSFKNGGVVEENAVFNASAGKVILNAHGSLYTGDIMGVERVDGQWVRMNTGVRTGAAIATRNYFGAGSFEARLKVAGELGVCSAMWTYYYSDEGYSDGIPIANHEIDIELPGRPGSALNDIGFDKALMVNWIGELGSLHTTNYTALDSAINDGNFHTWRFDWHTEESNRRIEFYVDGNLYAVNDKHVPFYAGRLWLGVWFPNRWAGDPNFAESQMEVDYVRFTPFLDEQYECPVESYPNSGWAPGTAFN